MYVSEYLKCIVRNISNYNNNYFYMLNIASVIEILLLIPGLKLYILKLNNIIELQNYEILPP